jgi:hypothetical protein
MMSSLLVFAYFSPETFLPVTSIIATVLGVIMMFGRTTFRLTVQFGRRLLRKETATTAMKEPHFRLRKVRDSEPSRR